MARRSMTAREDKRAKVRARCQKARAALKAAIKSPASSEEQRWEAQQRLQKLPRDASPVRMQRRCRITGRSRGVYRKFGLCRNKLREHVMQGQVPGVVKASW